MQLGAGNADGGADEGWRRKASGLRPPPVGLDLTMSKLQSQEPSPLLRSAVRTPTPEGQGSRRPKVSKVWSTHMPREVKVEFKNIRSATYDHSLAVELPASPETRLQVGAFITTSCRQPLSKPCPAGIPAAIDLIHPEGLTHPNRPGIPEPRAGPFLVCSGRRPSGRTPLATAYCYTWLRPLYLWLQEQQAATRAQQMEAAAAAAAGQWSWSEHGAASSSAGSSVRASVRGDVFEEAQVFEARRLRRRALSVDDIAGMPPQQPTPAPRLAPPLTRSPRRRAAPSRRPQPTHQAVLRERC